MKVRMTASPDKTLVVFCVISDAPLEFQDVAEAITTYITNTQIQINYTDALMEAKNNEEPKPA